MKCIALIIAVLLTECNGCWRKSEPSTTTTTSPPVEDVVKASNVHETDAAKKAQITGVDTAELRNISEELYKLDTNSVGKTLTLNLQSKTTADSNNDVAPQPLFTSSSTTTKEGNTLKLFRKLLDNYVPNVNTVEDNTNLENKEVNAFLDSVMSTPLMKRLEEFLKQKDLLKGRLRPALYHIWFTPYTRANGVIGSSGFEHVFLGEVKKGKITGFHNWIFFQKEEQEKDINYKGYLAALDLGEKGEILKMKFDWMNYSKPVGSMFIGTSPELDMALYTLCFYARQGKGCNLQMNGHRFRVKVYPQIYNGKNVIGSAYPEIF